MSNCSTSDSAAVVLPLPEAPRNAMCCLSSDGSTYNGDGCNPLVRPTRSGAVGAGEGAASATAAVPTDGCGSSAASVTRDVVVKFAGAARVAGAVSTTGAADPVA